MAKCRERIEAQRTERERKEKEEELQQQVLLIFFTSSDFLDNHIDSNNITIDHIHDACIENTDISKIDINEDDEDDEDDR